MGAGVGRSQMVKVLPSPRTLSTVMAPFIWLINSLEIANPRLVPAAPVYKDAISGWILARLQRNIQNR